MLAAVLPADKLGLGVGADAEGVARDGVRPPKGGIGRSSRRCPLMCSFLPTGWSADAARGRFSPAVTRGAQKRGL
eukprot:996957-Prorocentrum_minimum.AAC.1